MSKRRSSKSPHTPPRRLPAEWEPQGAVWFGFPYDRSIWDNVDSYEAMLGDYSQFVGAVAYYQPVVILAPDPDAAARALDLPRSVLPRVTWVQCDLNDCWIRDYGPVVVADKEGFVAPKWRFSGWGGRFEAALDNAASEFVTHRSTFCHWSWIDSDLTLEGGAIDADGRGGLIIHEASIGHDRNPGLDRDGVEQRLREELGAQRVYWAQKGHLTGDDTDLHVDLLVRFASPESLVIAQPTPGHPDQEALAELREEVSAWRTQPVKGKDRPFAIHEIPMPVGVCDTQGNQLSASYINYLLLDQAILVPQFDCEQDAPALEALGQAFPDRAPVGLPCRRFAAQGGGLHCMSMQIPDGAITLPLSGEVQ